MKRGFGVLALLAMALFAWWLWAPSNDLGRDRLAGKLQETESAPKKAGKGEARKATLGPSTRPTRAAAPRPGAKRGLDAGDSLRVSGTVSHDDGRPLGGIELLYVPGDHRGVSVQEALDLFEQGATDEVAEPLRSRVLERLPLRADASGRYSLTLPRRTPLGSILARPEHYSREEVELDSVLAEWRREEGAEADAWPADLIVDLGLAGAARVRGRIAEAGSGEPAEGVWLEAYAMPKTDRASRGVPVLGRGIASLAIADEEGRYEMSGLPTGRYFLLPTPGDTDYALDPGRAKQVSLRAGEQARVDFQVEMGGRIRVKVLNDHGLPFAGATCTIFRGGGLPPGEASLLARRRFGERRADGQGGCLFNGLALPGTYSVSAYHEKLTNFQRKEVTLDLGHPRAEVELRLWDRGEIAGRTVDGDGLAVASAMVSLRPLEDSEQSVATSVRSDDQGRFRFQGLAPGRYRISPERGVRPKERALEVHLAAGETIDELEIDVVGERTTLAGRVVDDLGIPLAGTSIRIDAPGGDAVSVRLNSDSAGGFSTRELSGDRFTVFADLAGYKSAKKDNVKGGTTDLEIVLRRLATVSGRLVDASGRAVTEATLKASYMNRERPGVVTMALKRIQDSDGRFEVKVRPGTLWLLAEADGRADGASERLDLAPGQHLTGVRIALTDSGSLSGRVLAPDGQPLPDASVRAARIDEDRADSSLPPGLITGGTSLTDLQGEYVLEQLHPGRYRVGARHPDHSASKSVEVDLPPSGEVRVPDLKLGAGGTLRVRIVKADGRVQAHDILARDRYGGIHRADPLSENLFVIKDMPPGKCLVRARRGGLSALAEAWIPESGTSDVVLDFDSGFKVAGLIPETHGKRYLVSLKLPGDPGYLYTWQSPDRPQPDGSATFEFQNIPAGSYQLSLYEIDPQGSGERQPKIALSQTIEVQDRDLELTLAIPAPR